MNYTKKVAFNTGAQIVGKAVITAIALTSIGILTRYLGVSGYGEYTTVFAFVSFLSIIADFGFFWIFMRQAAALKNRQTLNHLASNLFTLRIVIAILIYLVGIGAGFLLNYPPIVKVGIAVITGAFFLQSVNSTLVGVFQLNYRIDKAVLAEAVGRTVILAGIILCQKLRLDLLWILAVYILGGLFNVGLNAFWARIYVSIRPAFDFKLWRKIFTDAWPMGVLSVLGIIIFKIDTVMLSLFKGASSADMGIYGAAYKIIEVVGALPLMFLGAVFPLVMQYLKEQNLSKLQRALQKSFDFLAILAVPVVLGTIMTADKIIGVVGGREFVSATTVSVWGYSITAASALSILIIATGIAFFSSMFSDLIIALGKQKYLILPNLLFVILNIGLNILVIPRWSYLGTSLTTFVTEATILIFNGFIFWKFLFIKPRLGILPKVFFAGLVMSALLYLTKSANIVILMTAGAAVYFAMLLGLKAVSWQMIREILGK